MNLVVAALGVFCLPFAAAAAAELPVRYKRGETSERSLPIEGFPWRFWIIL